MLVVGLRVIFLAIHATVIVLCCMSGMYHVKWPEKQRIALIGLLEFVVVSFQYYSKV